MKVRVRYSCSACGNYDVSWDAWADWDVEKQEEVLRTSFDDSFCHDCECGQKLKRVEDMVPDINPLETPEQRIKGLLEANNLLVEKNRNLKRQLERDQSQFNFYSISHAAKTTATRVIPMTEKEINDTLEKSKVNRQFVDDIEKVLSEN